MVGKDHLRMREVMQGRSEGRAWQAREEPLVQSLRWGGPMSGKKAGAGRLDWRERECGQKYHQIAKGQTWAIGPPGSFEQEIDLS